MTTLFISDLHLDPTRPAVSRAFLDLLEQQVPQADALYILGDFFEAWIGDDDDSPLIQEITTGLKSCTDNGTPVYIMHGNRDFLIGQDFCEKTGCQLLEDPSVVDLYGKPVLLAHGDALCTDDQAYMAFRQQCRNPAWQQQMLTQPLEARRELAKQLRMQSKEANSNKAEDIMDVNADAVTELMQQHPTNLLIHGHTHRPAVHNDGTNENTRIVLGDWDQKAWLLSYFPDHQYELNSYDIR